MIDLHADEHKMTLRWLKRDFLLFKKRMKIKSLEDAIETYISSMEQNPHHSYGEDLWELRLFFKQNIKYFKK
jgi:hypothetical protein